MRVCVVMIVVVMMIMVVVVVVVIVGHGQASFASDAAPSGTSQCS